jgi:hypothetical protein
MLSLTVHAILGVVVIWTLIAGNRAIFRRPAAGPLISPLEGAYYLVGVVSVLVGWYFNVRFVMQYAHGHTNPIWGDGSWAQYIKLMYANPAASSAGEDYTIANVILLPLMTIVDGRRRGINRPWLYFVASLFTSFAFAWAFYLATIERQRRISSRLRTRCVILSVRPLSYATTGPAVTRDTTIFGCIIFGCIRSGCTGTGTGTAPRRVGLWPQPGDHSAGPGPRRWRVFGWRGQGPAGDDGRHGKPRGRW